MKKQTVYLTQPSAPSLFILLKEIGSAYVDRQVTEEEMKLGLEAVLE